MTDIPRTITSKVVELLKSPEGVNAQVRELGEHTTHEVKTFVPQNAAPELFEKSLPTRYPAIFVYCEKVANILKEKFRVFSGMARMVVEVRCSEDRLEGIDSKLQVYVAAVCHVLDHARGEWAHGIYYTGGYEVVYGPARSGGQSFLQIAKVTFEVQVSK